MITTRSIWTWCGGQLKKMCPRLKWRYRLCWPDWMIRATPKVGHNWLCHPLAVCKLILDYNSRNISALIAVRGRYSCLPACHALQREDCERMSKGRILVVEDDADISNMLKIYFTGRGYDIQTARKGKDALDMTQQQLPQLIVLDINLPDMDGYTILKTLRTNFGMDIRVRDMPLMEGARECAHQWLFPRGSFCNRDFYSPHVRFADGIGEEMRMLL